MDALVRVGGVGRELAAWWLPITVWTGALLVLALLLDRVLRGRVGPGMRAILFGAVLVRAALPIDWQAPLGVVANAPSTPLVVAAPTVADAPAIAAETQASAHAVEMPSVSPDALGLAIAAIWLLGTLLVVGTVLARMRVGIDGRAREAVKIDDATAWLDPALGPMIVGLRRPRIVLPRKLVDTLDRDVLGAVVRHELTHIRHRDGWVALALALICALVWPVVPVWIAASRIRLAMELRADAHAVQGLGDAAIKAYRKLLLELAAQRWLGPSAAVGMGAVSGLHARLRALASARRPWRLQVLFVAPLAIALVVTSGVRTAEQASLAAVALGGTPRIAAGPIPFPHCADTDAAKALPIPADHDAQLLATGRTRLALATRAMLLPSVETIDWTDALRGLMVELRDVPVGQAEVRFVIGLSEARRGRLKEAEHDLAETAWLAASHRDDHLAAEAAFALVDVVERSGHADEAKSWSVHAFAASRRLGQDRFAYRATALRALARIAERRGEAELAREHTENAAQAERECNMQLVD